MYEPPEPPYLDMRYRPSRWIGTKPPRKSPNNPTCPACGENDRVEIAQYAVVNTDGVFHRAVYRCYRCDRDF